MRYPVLASRGCEAEHGLLYVVLGEFGFSLSEVEKFGEKNMSIDQIKSAALE
jgi:hypothetical protein